MHFVEPKFKGDDFTCPHCGTLSNMSWSVARHPSPYLSSRYLESEVSVAFCKACKEPSIWLREKMIFPDLRGVEPHADMPSKAREIFCEAQSVIGKSPRAACALLRMCLEVLVSELGGKGKTLYEKVESLNLPPDLEEVFRACRIVGNQAAHPGVINFDSPEGKDLTETLSGFINLIVAFLISPKIQAKKILQDQGLA